MPETVLTPAPAAEPTAAPAPAAVTREDLGAIVQAINGWSQQVVQHVQQGQPQQQAPAPRQDPDDLLTRLAQNDTSPIQGLIDARLKEAVVPFLGAQIQEAAAANESASRAQIDAEFGAGTYDATFKPAVDAQLSSSPTTRGFKTSWDQAVSSVKGQKFGELMGKHTAHKAAEAAAVAAAETKRHAAWLPANGFAPIPTNALSDDDTALMAEISRKTGGRVPSAEGAAKTRDLLMQHGHKGVSMEELQGIFAPKA